MTTGVEKAVEAAGSQAALAKELGVTQQAVSLWRRCGFVPALRALEIEQITGVPRSELVSPRLRELVGASPTPLLD